ncbi:MAG: hypothetical protein R3B49_09900 [Phycisphaerales bacterium]
MPAGTVREGEAEQFLLRRVRDGVGRAARGGLERSRRTRAVDAEAQQHRRDRARSRSSTTPAFAKAYVKPLPGGLCEDQFLLEGVHCARACG